MVEQHHDLEQGLLLRRKDNIIRKQRPRRRQRIIRPAENLRQRRAPAKFRQERHSRRPSIFRHALLALAQLEPAAPAGDQLESPQVPVPDGGLDGAALVAEVAVDDGGREGFLELLLALRVPALEELFVGAEAGLGCDADAPGQGNGVAEAGGDALATNWKACQLLKYRAGLGVCLQGGKTWAESPQRITRPSDHLLQLRAEKVKGLDRTTSMQFSGNAKSSSKLPKSASAWCNI